MNEVPNQPKVEHLAEGQEAWTLPESIRQSDKGTFHIDPSFPIVQAQGGENQVRVWRDQKGFHARAFVPRVYEPQRIPRGYIELRTFERPI